MARALPLDHDFVDCSRLCGTCHAIPHCGKSREEHEPNGTPIHDAAQELELRWKADAALRRVLHAVEADPSDMPDAVIEARAVLGDPVLDAREAKPLNPCDRDLCPECDGQS
jgi:hypothetical protein